MKRILIVLAGLLALSFFTAALAQATSPQIPLPAFDFKAWGSSAATFATFLAAAVALIKGRVSDLAGWGVLLLALVLGELGAFLLYAAGLLTDPAYAQFNPPWIWLAFGFSAFVLASGGYALVFQLITGFFHIKRRTQTQLAPVVGDHLILPAGTPGTEPLMHNGVQIGAVLPLTLSNATVIATPGR